MAHHRTIVGHVGVIACSCLLGIPSPASGGTACPCLGDLSGNGVVDGSDLGVLLGAWGPCDLCDACPADLSGDCVVDGADLGILLGGWGPCAQLPPNDLCANATQITAFTGSANPFCTIGASTDGPALGACGAPPIDNVHSDVWFRVTAPLTGHLQIGVCADFDVRMAIYGENVAGLCSCPGGLFGAPLLACSGTDSFPACSTGTARILPVVAGDCYTIRVGGAAGQQGTGNVDINVYVPPCEVASSTKLAAGGLENDTEFGISLDISGDVAVAGAIFDDIFLVGSNAGSARVYRHDGVGWNPEQTLLSPDLFAFQRFGINVAASGDRIVVGAGEVDEDCVSDPGCSTGIAYLYRHDGSTWGFEQSLTPSAGTPADSFGARVDIDGLRTIIGARNDDNANGDRAGAAYVFEYLAFFDIWFQSAKLVASDGDDFDEFGSDVAVSGAWAIVGADSDEGGGAAYIFEDTGAAWVQRAKIKPAGLPATANFGYAVTIEGDVALVGAPDFLGGAGAVYVYENFGAAGWLQTAVLTAHDGAAGDSFGSAVSLAPALPYQQQAMVGAGGDDGARGSAYVFWRVSGGWVERAKLTASDGAAGDVFGNASVAISGGRGLVGAYLDDIAAGTNAGSVAVFTGLGECTGNGVMDACDIADGLPDSDGDGVPDICEP